MKTKNKITGQEKLFQYTVGVFIGFILWCCTLVILLILN